jgi:hypothetical protein
VHDYSSTLTGLAMNTTYHYRFAAYNNTKAGYGADVTFTTGAAPLPPPTVTTLTPSAITTDSAQFNGSVNPNGTSTTAFFEYGLTANYGSTTPPVNVGAGTTAQNTAATVGLAANTTYHYRLDAYNSGGTSYGEDATFTTASVLSPPTLVSPGAATAAGPTLTNLAPTFSWTAVSQASSYDLVISQYPAGNVVITASVGGTSYQLPSGILQAGTAYAWYMTSFDSLGDQSSASGSLYFQTQAAPAVQTLAATNIVNIGAGPSVVLNGSVNPNGSSTTVYFEYGLTSNYGSVTTQTGIGTTVETFSAGLTGLEPGQIYHYRIDAYNSAGASYGQDMTFTSR